MFVAFLLATIIFPQKTFAQEKHAGESANLLAQTIPENTLDVNLRAMAIKKVIKKYYPESPLIEYSDVFVRYADKYGLDWKLLPAISGLESYFAKFYVYGSYNAYGWGGGYIYFGSWEDGIATVSKALRINYADKWGARTVYEIGPIYSESPTWATRVKFFMKQIDDAYSELTLKQINI